MGTVTIRAGVRAALDGVEYKFKRKIDGHIWQLEDTRSLRITEFKRSTIRELFQSGRLVFESFRYSISSRGEGVKLSDLSDLQIAEAKIRRMYVLAIIEYPSTQSAIQAPIRAVWEKLCTKDRCPSPATVLRWKQRYIDSGKDITALVSQTHRKGNRASRYSEEVINIVNDVIDEVYMVQERGTYQDVLDESLLRVKKENAMRPSPLRLKRPTFRFVKRLVKQINAFDRCSARYGRTAAIARFRHVNKLWVADVPLERAEIDHTLLDLIVIDDNTFMPLGRPWLTVCIDTRTRVVLGIYLGFEPPSHLTVAACLRHAFLPKDGLRALYPSIENAWCAYGVMQELVVDNGAEFHSDSLETACLSLGVEMHFSARKTPWHKGKVERFLKTLNDAVSHKTPGTTFSNILEKGDYDPAKHAIVRLSKIQEIVLKWIVDVYHQRPHRTTALPPELDWKSSIDEDDIPLPTDAGVLDAILGRKETRTLTHKGIELDCLFYNSPELADLRKRYGEKFKVELRIDDSNIGEIIVLCPFTGDLYRVPAINPDYAAGLSRWQHRVCRSYARRIFDKTDWESWLQAKHDIAEMVREEFMVRKGGTRTRAARHKNAGKQTAAGESLEPSANEPSTPTSDEHPIDVHEPIDNTESSESSNDFDEMDFEFDDIPTEYVSRSNQSEEINHESS